MRQAVSALELPSAARRIGIKLNLCDYRKADSGATSDPASVRALLQVLRERYVDAEILLLENDASDTLVTNIWGYLGMDVVAREFGARCMSLSQEVWIPVSIPSAERSIEIPRVLRECDVLINHPKLKTHGKTIVTCALKNLFGYFRAKDKGPLHADLDEAIVRINRAVPRHVVLVDADLCVEGNRGPTQGFPRRIGLYLAGADPVAVDSFCTTLMGFSPRRIGHIRKAAAAGIGSMKFELAGDLVGEPLAPYRFAFSRPNLWLMRVARRIVSWSDLG